MKRSGFAKRQAQMEDAIFNAGKQTGSQYAADCFAIAAKKHGVSKANIIAITKEAMEIGQRYQAVFNVRTDAEADVAQYHFDELLQAIYGDLFEPFSERYDWIKEVKY